jgi:hypothetical protein
MAAEPQRHPAGGRDEPVDGGCAPLQSSADELLGGPCSCLPQVVDDWPACASCGLPQKPGKAFCSFCGRRWVTESADGEGPVAIAR